SSGTSREKLEDQLPKLTAAHKAQNRDAQQTITPKLQPLKDLHFNSELRIFNHSRSVVEKSTLQILLVVAGLLLVIAVINFVNLETAQASKRAKEVGVRKVLGSSRQELITRFLSESFILCVLAATVSVVLAELGFRYFPYYIPEGFEFNVDDPLILMFLLSCVFVVTLFAGLYPAFVLSSYQPALALKNLASSTTATTRSAFIRKGLTIFQFSFAQVFIIGTIVIIGQLDFMLNKDLGFSADAVVFVSTPYQENGDRAASFKTELEQHPEIEALTLHGNPPLTAGIGTAIMGFDNGKEIITQNVHLKQGDTSFLRVYGIQLLAGRNVLPVDSAHELLINETYMKLLGFKEPRDVIGKTIDNVAPIVGVVRDFHGQPLRIEIKPTAISYRPGRNLGIKLITPKNNVADLKGVMAKIETSYGKIFPDEEFRYFFVDERIQEFYQTEQRMGQIAGLSTVIAILISCLGLFGLSSFTVIQRTKEIGIRKVLGASINSILFLLSKDFLKLVLIAFILSAPIAYYVTDVWLEKFAYKMDVTAWIFIASGVASVFIALITISFRTVNAAKADPVKSLRYE
ncbi:MAG TPA: FtsX-like permease family protein, partial [Flavitalea sp.]|nr:FtsX-like permease family protein [Flavitalea sp.]